MTKDGERLCEPHFRAQGTDRGKRGSAHFSLRQSGSTEPGRRIDQKHRSGSSAWQGGRHFRDSTESSGHGETDLSTRSWAINAQEDAHAKEYERTFPEHMRNTP